MALYNDPTRLRQPGSVLQPKPGLLDAGGNQPTPVLQQPEQQPASFGQPTITPQSEYKPMADPVNATNSPLSYQEAFTQGQLNGGAYTPGADGAVPGGGFGGFDPLAPPSGYGDPRAWAQTEFGGDRAQGFSYLDPSTNQMAWAATEQDPNYQRSVNATRVAGGLSAFQPSDFSNFGGYAPPQTAAQPQTGGFTPGQNEEGGLGDFGDVTKPTNPVKVPTITPAGGQPNVNPIQNTMDFGGVAKPVNPNKPQAGSESGDDGLSKLFQYLKGGLERERDVGKDNARTNAASRGVFYGTPGVSAEADIDEKFNRGLGEMSANLFQNEQQNDLQRLGLATNFFGTLGNQDIQRLAIAAGLIPSDVSASDGIDPNIFAALGQLFGGQGAAGGYDITDQVPQVPTVKPVTGGLTPNTATPQTTLPTPFPAKPKATLTKSKY